MVQHSYVGAGRPGDCALVGAGMAFRLVRYESPNGNVGDDFSGWLFSRALGERLRPDGEILLFGVGSIFTERFARDNLDSSIRTCVVFGSGARGGNSLPKLGKADWRFYCVRGPLTAGLAGLPSAAAITDPAALAPRLFPLQGDATGPVGIVPYFIASELAWKKVADRLGWQVISPRLPVEEFFKALTRCSRVWCESMHGAIFADAYCVPWRPIAATSLALEGRTHAFKWTDWSASMAVSFDRLAGLPLPEGASGAKARLKERIKVEIMTHRLAKADLQDRYNLSERKILTERQDRLSDRLDAMCRELSGEPMDLDI